MYDDTALQAADQDVALVLSAALAESKAGAGILYQIALNHDRPFDLVIDVESSATADYYGYTDVVYHGTSESFLFGSDKFNVRRASTGLSLRIVLNVAHANEGGQRLATLVHEIGVHATLLFGAIVVLNKDVSSPAEVKDREEVLVTQLENGAFSADDHHTRFGSGGADDYNDLKAGVATVLDRWASNPLRQLAYWVGFNHWYTMKEAFTKANASDSDLHAKIYWHPKVRWQETLKRADELSRAAAELEARMKAAQQSRGLFGFLSSWSS